jgi:hypothetical protein
MAELITSEDLPAGFSYPVSFLRIVGLGLVDLEPWFILDGEGLYERYRGLQERYQARELVPFARWQDNDDVACWDGGEGSKVLVIHDFADPGWELRRVLPSFYAWLRQAVEDLIEFEPED